MENLSAYENSRLYIDVEETSPSPEEESRWAARAREILRKTSIAGASEQIRSEKNNASYARPESH